MRQGNQDSCGPGSASSCCGGLNRREFLKLAGAAALTVTGGAVRPRGAMAGPFVASDFQHLVPVDKKLSPEWVASLYQRGEPTVYRGAALERIGMPVGGVCAGQVYLGGDGRLWHWDIFNLTQGTGDSHYAHPPLPQSPFEQGFSLRMTSGSQTRTRRLDTTGFSDISFSGQYPIGAVTYHDPEEPITAVLEAFSPFIPLNAEDSSLPAIVLEYTLRNTGHERTEVELTGFLENPVCHWSRAGQPETRVRQDRGMTVLECSAAPFPAGTVRPPVVFESFEGDTYGPWTVEGEAFGPGPAHGALAPEQSVSGFEGKGLVNSYRGGDGPQGTLTSAAFTIERPYISFLIGGGNHPGETCVNLLDGDRVVRTATGRDSDSLFWENWDVQDLQGKSVRIQIVDHHSGGWGHIDLDQIEFRDLPHSAGGPLEEQPDYGTMTLAVLGRARGAATESPVGPHPGISRTVTLDPGKSARVTFILAWHFPNLKMDRLPGGRRYATRFASATAVADYVARNRSRLTGDTRKWRQTWYDSSLPHWFMERTFANTSILATSTVQWFPNGRFYGWEGVGCCPGTCTHVWHYAHAAARVFPELERSSREMADYDPEVSFDPKNGLIDFRAEFRNGYAADGQAGCVLRTYREHQMSADNSFLRQTWPRVKHALEFLIGQDGNDDGILEGAQPNTLDSAWYGPISWISSLYVAALRAGEAMAREMGDEPFATRARTIADRGSQRITDLLWNGEYFIQRPDPAHPEAMRSGDGCEVDQVFGQSWAWQIGLGRILPQDRTLSALRSLWKYNFTPDVGPYREKFKIGRWYAMPGEAGLIMCTFPRGGREGYGGKIGDWAAGYFNECMNGFEYQVAGHMIWEGMVQEGLAVTRALHDRYDASRRNPWNEVECGDHYARSMASYGVFLAACGFEYHGPHGHLGFAPRLSPEAFRAPFTAAEGWGTLTQQIRGGRQTAGIEVRWGHVKLRRVSLELAAAAAPAAVTVKAGGQSMPVSFTVEGRRLTVALEEPVTLRAGQRIELEVA